MTYPGSKGLLRIAFAAAIATVFCIAGVDAATLKGKVTAVIGDEITLELTGALLPRTGDPVEVLFKTPDGDEVPVGEWTVSGVDGKKVRAKKKEAFGDVQVGYVASIDSANPVRPRARKMVRETVPPEERARVIPVRPSLEDKYLRARVYYRGKGRSRDYRKAYGLFLEGARKGHAKSMVMTGVMHEMGYHVPKNRSKAVSWYRRAASKGSAWGQTNLAYMYANGRGVKRNYARAVRYYKLAAAQNYARAQANLGNLYERGRGVRRNYTEAARFYRAAADKGNVFAAVQLASLYERGRGVRRDYRKARDLFKWASDKGSSRALFRLGWMYHKGKGVRADFKTAAAYYRRSAEKGYAGGQSNYAYMLMNGYGVKRDDRLAVKWLRRAAGKRNADAMFNLGYMVSLGRGARRDLWAAEKWFMDAAKINRGYSLFEVARGFDGKNIGWGFPKNKNLAQHFYKRAAARGDRRARKYLQSATDQDDPYADNE